MLSFVGVAPRADECSSRCKIMKGRVDLGRSYYITATIDLLLYRFRPSSHPDFAPRHSSHGCIPWVPARSRSKRWWNVEPLTNSPRHQGAHGQDQLTCSRPRRHPRVDPAIRVVAGVAVPRSWRLRYHRHGHRCGDGRLQPLARPGRKGFGGEEE